MEKTIAIIDDSRTIRSILRKAVLAASIDVKEFHEADNGLDGLALVRNFRSRLSLIIMDINMPKMDGIQMLEAIQKEGIGGVPVLVVSSRADDTVRASCRALGAKAFVGKPFTHESFRSALELAFSGTEPRAGAAP